MPPRLVLVLVALTPTIKALALARPIALHPSSEGSVLALTPEVAAGALAPAIAGAAARSGAALAPAVEALVLVPAVALSPFSQWKGTSGGVDWGGTRSMKKMS